MSAEKRCNHGYVIKDTPCFPCRIKELEDLLISVHDEICNRDGMIKHGRVHIQVMQALKDVKREIIPSQEMEMLSFEEFAELVFPGELHKCLFPKEEP